MTPAPGEDRCLVHGTDYQECPACYRAERNALRTRLRAVEGERDVMREQVDTHLEDRQRQYERANAAWDKLVQAEQRAQANEDAYRDCTRANGDLRQRVAGVKEQCAVIAESFDPWDEHYPCCKKAAAKAIRESND